MFVAAAVCPHPPLLVPEVAAGAAGELDDLREQCLAAVGAVLDASPDRLLVVGGGADLHAERAGGSLRPFGVDIHAGAPDDSTLPLSLTIGAWLIERVRPAETEPLPVEYVGLGDGTAPADAADRLARIVTGPERVGVLAMADLSARRTIRSPGYLHPRAEGFDDDVVDALSAVDLTTLTGLDVELAREVWCSGVPALAALAGAARTAGHPVVARLWTYVAPYGVGYAVVTWAAGGSNG